MSPSTAVQELHQRYAELSQRGARSLTGDEAESLRFYRVDLAVFHDPQKFADTHEHVALWTLETHAFDSFVARERRIPRQNNRAPRGLIPRAEWDLAGWLARQRSAIRLSRRCSYQVGRLYCLAGFTAWSYDELWDAQLQKYRRFIDANGSAPRGRSNDELESSLAGWAAKQRMYFRAGTLPRRRIEALSGLVFWTWGEARLTKVAPRLSGRSERSDS